MSERELDLLLLGSSGSGDSGLGGLRLDHALLKLINSAGGIDELLLAGVKRVAGVANTKDGRRFGRAGLDYIATGATDFRVDILRVQISFHIKKRAEGISGAHFDKRYFHRAEGQCAELTERHNPIALNRRLWLYPSIPSSRMSAQLRCSDCKMLFARPGKP